MSKSCHENDSAASSVRSRFDGAGTALVILVGTMLLVSAPLVGERGARTSEPEPPAALRGTPATRLVQAPPPVTARESSSDLFAYDPSVPLDLRVSGGWVHGLARGREVTYRSLRGEEIGATLIEPVSQGTHAGILFVHWYEPEASTSNRTQFLEEARRLTERGAVSLLIDTMWSDTTWFETRDQQRDFADSVQQVKELRRALDLLLTRPQVDPNRIAYVGHDFGAMYGTVMASVDRRVGAYALQAGTTSFSDWFLLFPPLEGEPRQRFIEQLTPLDPVRLVGAIAPAPLLLQFGTGDPYVPRERAEELVAAAGEPKSVRWYDGGHALTPGATRDRMEWLADVLGLGPVPVPVP